MSRNRIRLLGAAAAAAVAIVASAGAVSAHVTVNPDTASQGGFTKLTFGVPDEKERASTTKVQVFLPADQPLGSVSVKPHPGWKTVVTKAKLAKPIKTDDGQVTEAVSAITWIATSPAAATKPGEFDEFEVSAGPLPKAASMEFKVLQTYSDADVVRWIEPATANGAEPAHPAPTLKLTPAVAEGAGATVATSSPIKSSGTAATGSSSDNTARGLSVAALIIAIVAGALSAQAVAMRRPRSGR
jgi:uncharacterized protein YcnI